MPRIKVEVRAAKKGRAIVGYAARFNSLSQDLGGFRERLLPGCFSRALSGSPDVLCLVDHDEGRLLGRASSGTLRLKETNHGLAFRCDLGNTTEGNDIFESVKRGDIQGASFSFECGDDDWSEQTAPDGRTFIRRDVRSVSKLFDVAPVISPAYRSTSVQADVDDLALEDDGLLDDEQEDEDEFEDEESK